MISSWRLSEKYRTGGWQIRQVVVSGRAGRGGVNKDLGTSYIPVVVVPLGKLRITRTRKGSLLRVSFKTKNFHGAGEMAPQQLSVCTARPEDPSSIVI